MKEKTVSAGLMQCAALTVKTKPLQIEARVEVTAKGLLAIATLVSSILLASAVVVRAAARRR
ncbi:hypothetical protein ACSFBM_16520 [Variovorax sp. GB1R11]|uniref:hypothetical protein n=1 Tax=Variovorax sp. GB1R11 TaxID=3443741 RepID=UPI003F46622B